jgi:phage FluMu protein Com
MTDKIHAKCTGCGKTLAVPATVAGKKVRCPVCQNVVQVPEAPAIGRPGSGGTSEREPNQVRQQPGRPAPRKRRATPSRRSAPPPQPVVDDFAESDFDDFEDIEDYDEIGADIFNGGNALPPRTGKAGRQKTKRSELSSPSGGSEDKTATAQIIGGIAMMVGAVAWFVGGLIWMNRIFFYPPIMFVIGLVGLIKGLVTAAR